MTTFKNEEINLDMLPKYEEVQLYQPDKKYWYVIQLNLFIFLIFTASTITILLYANELLTSVWITLGILIIVFLGIFLFFIYKLSFKKRGYALRMQDVIYKSGVITESTTIVPLHRIQHIALHEGIFSRIFGLGTLQIFTASGHSGEITIKGLRLETANNLKEAIAQASINKHEQGEE